MEQTISLNLTRNSVEKFSEVFNSLETLDTKNIDILIIVSIKNKLKICLLSLEEKEFTINFTYVDSFWWYDVFHVSFTKETTTTKRRITKQYETR